jgi:hypothetical protein
MLMDALDGVQRFLLGTADADQVPTMRAITNKVPERNVTLIAPPGRLAIAEFGGITYRIPAAFRGKTEGTLSFPETYTERTAALYALCQPCTYNLWIQTDPLLGC